MIRLIYYIISSFILFILGLIKPFLQKKTKLFRLLQGRKNSMEALKKLPQKDKKRIWAHAASLGEYQMLLPLLEHIEQTHAVEIHITFFSPSGFEHAETPTHWSTYYLQHDTPTGARRFLHYLQPDLAIFAKYEFWLGHLNALNRCKIPFIYWNTLVREGHFLTKFWGTPWRKALDKALVICCQNASTQSILTNLLPNAPIEVTGDIRFLQMAKLRELPSKFSAEEIRRLEAKPIVIWGSSWQEEFDVLKQVLPLNKGKYQFILAPHDVSEPHLQQIEQQIQGNIVRFSQWLKKAQDAELLLIDGIGLLRYAYRFARVAIVGGGFHNALHNIIEPLSYGVPVLIGSNHRKFPEAQAAVDAKAAVHASNPARLSEHLSFLLFHENHESLLLFHRQQAVTFFEGNMPKMEIVIPYVDGALTK